MIDYFNDRKFKKCSKPQSFDQNLRALVLYFVKKEFFLLRTDALECSDTLSMDDHEGKSSMEYEDCEAESHDTTT